MVWSQRSSQRDPSPFKWSLKGSVDVSLRQGWETLLGGILILCSSSFPEEGFSLNTLVILYPPHWLKEKRRRLIGWFEGGMELSMPGSAFPPTHLGRAQFSSSTNRGRPLYAVPGKVYLLSGRFLYGEVWPFSQCYVSNYVKLVCPILQFTIRKSTVAPYLYASFQ